MPNLWSFKENGISQVAIISTHLGKEQSIVTKKNVCCLFVTGRAERNVDKSFGEEKKIAAL